MKLTNVTVSVIVGASLIACGTAKKSDTAAPQVKNALDFTDVKAPKYLMIVTDKNNKSAAVTSDTLLSPKDAVAKANAKQVIAVTSDKQNLDASTESFWSITDFNCQNYSFGGYSNITDDSGSTVFNNSQNTMTRQCQPIYSDLNVNVGYAPMAVGAGLPSQVMPYGTGSVGYYQPSMLSQYGYGAQAMPGVDTGYGYGSPYATSNNPQSVGCAQQAAFASIYSQQGNSNCYRSDYSYVW